MVGDSDGARAAARPMMWSSTATNLPGHGTIYIRMRPSLARWGPVTLAAAFALTACAGTTPGGVQTSAEPAEHAATGDTVGIARDRARADSARYPYTEADVHFMSAMIGHHSQALLMAGWAPSRAAGQSVRTLAERIINGQQDEIGTMQQWLGDRGKPVPDTARMGTSGQAHHGMSMPGMLTEAQLRQLERANGGEFDRLFLTYMIQHHRGAVAMVKDLFGSQGAAQDEIVFKFANDVSVDQSTEIERMERMLAALTAEERSP